MRIMIVRLLRRKLYAWYNAYRIKENTKVRNYNLRDWDSEMNMNMLIGMLALRGRKIHLLPIGERGRRLLLHTSFRTRVRIGHLVSPGRGCVISAVNLDI